MSDEEKDGNLDKKGVQSMKKMALMVVLVMLFMVVGSAHATPDLMGTVNVTFKTTEPQITVDKYGYHVAKLKTYSFPFSGSIYLYWANPAPHGDVPPNVSLDLSTPSDCGDVKVTYQR
jgi:hypothetical protein